MLPEDSPEFCSGCGVYGGWPASGEIDIMEAVNDMYTIYSTMHYGGPAGTMSSAWYNSWDNPLNQVCAGTRRPKCGTCSRPQIVLASAVRMMLCDHLHGVGRAWNSLVA